MMEKKPTHRYCVIEDGDPSDDGLVPDYSFASAWDEDDLEWLAEDAAENFHSDHDGWEYDWPVRFALFNMDGRLIGKCEVDLEHVPSFSATTL